MSQSSAETADRATCPVAHHRSGRQSPSPADRSTWRVAHEVPGPAPVPILGWRGNLMRYFRNPIGTLLHLHRTYGQVATLVRGGSSPIFFRTGKPRTSTVFALGAEASEQVLRGHDVFESDTLRGPSSCSWLVENMSRANRDDRKAQRKLMTPAFKREHLQAYYPDMVRFTEAMLERWRPGQQLDLFHEAETLSAHVASKTFYGQDPDQEGVTLAGLAREVTQCLFSPMSLLPLDLPGSPYRRFVKLASRARRAVLEDVEHRRASGAIRDDALTMMVRALEEGDVQLSEDELIGNAFTLYLAGHEAPATALAFTLLLLAQHPAVAAELLDELDRELGGGPPSFEQQWKLPVLDRVIKESLRILGPAVILWRRATSDTSLCGYDIPAGTEVLFSPYTTHVDPSVWPDPFRFRPDRWLEGRPATFTYLPFSYGFRKCVGNAFAEMFLRVILPMIVQRYRLQLTPDARIDLKVTFTMRPKNGLPVLVHPQDRRMQDNPVPLRGDICKMVDFSA